MPRIPDTELERLKREISVQRLVEGSGVALQKSGKDWLALCPFHEDREPSLVVSPGKNLWHCFGCQVGGGPIDWVMKHKGVTLQREDGQAVEWRPALMPNVAVYAVSITRCTTPARTPSLSGEAIPAILTQGLGA
ncbi:CHC2 zinc finger domain-containing protein [Cupriavidus sp. 30B13]|uniref:CHC2 zinc finger domain-containing protein n=1 Tax=Cupriavidus sp. 30B13 TaxID=3384241 RepID=UPI003B8F4BDA